MPLVAATAVGLVALWPSGEPQRTGVIAVDTEYPVAVITTTEVTTCAGANEDRRPDGTIPSTVACTLVGATVQSGDQAGRVIQVWAPATVRPQDATPGTKIVLARYLESGQEEEVWAWQDFSRTVPLGLLAGAYSIVVIAVAGLRGLRSLLGLGFAFVVLGTFMLPALLQGRDPLAVGVVGSAAIMLVVLYLAHGLSHRTTTALLGTFAGLGVTAVLGVVAAGAARLNGITSEETYRLAMLTGQLDGYALRGLFLAGVVLAGLGVLNDVTITQASAVWELSAADPSATAGQLFSRGMRIGRDHIASTVYTIAFAYAGAALPVLLLVQVYRMPALQTFSSGQFAEEIARTAVGSIGLVLAIPLTTLIAVAVVRAAPQRPARHRARPTAHEGGLHH
ncbi:YibE/F family protein [Actinotalea sp. AC32]|nr:YibE/F family protein [Actinotalea sp. AC32]